MRDNLHWLHKNWSTNDSKDLMKMLIGLGGGLFLYSRGYRRGYGTSRKDMHKALKHAEDRELTFIDPGKNGHGFTAKYF